MNETPNRWGKVESADEAINMTFGPLKSFLSQEDRGALRKYVEECRGLAGKVEQAVRQHGFEFPDAETFDDWLQEAACEAWRVQQGERVRVGSITLNELSPEVLRSLEQHEDRENAIIDIRDRYEAEYLHSTNK